MYKRQASTPIGSPLCNLSQSNGEYFGCNSFTYDKFVYADKSLGTQMMATGEVMSIGNSFEAAMMKAVSSIELGMDTLTHKPFEELTDDEIVAHMHVQDLSLIHIC